ncbi:MAG: hypothetical protein HS113_26880 [Verrucomicrobiales bacterium]|nr:hypothetical protein [Verrucomicrobiales bacterium]
MYARPPLLRTCFFLALFATALPVRPGPVADWNHAAREAIRAARTSPPVASRGLAMLHVAIYDAVNGIARTHTAFRVTEPGPDGAAAQAAVSGAAYHVLRHLFPGSDLQRTNLDVVYAAQMAGLSDGPATATGLAWGEQVGALIVAARAGDGSTQPGEYTPEEEPGVWRPTPPAHGPALLPRWGQVVPFTMTSGAQFRPHPPPPLGSSAYAFEVNLVEFIDPTPAGHGKRFYRAKVR